MYFPPFIYSFIIASLSLFLLVLAGKFFPEKRTSFRHIHKKGIPRLGGVAVILAFGVSLIIDRNLFITHSIWGILVVSGIILIVGVLDDLKELSWKSQLFIQIMLVIFVFIVGIRVEYVTNPLGGVFDLMPGGFFLPSLIFSMVWILSFMNSMNWLDGVDGLSGGVTLVGGITIFILSLKPEVNQPPVAIIASALVGSVLAFLIFNLHPAKIFAGTSGSMFMGFALAVLAIFAGTKIATALLIMAVPIIDALWVVFERMKSGQSIFEADKRHLHYKLAEIGWSPRLICLFFYVVTIAVAIVALNTRAIGKAMTIVLAAVIMVIFVYYVNRRINLEKTSLR